MKNKELEQDYYKRALARRKALTTLFQEESWADVVREAQEVLELLLKAYLRKNKILPPRTHDLSNILLENIDHFQDTPKKTIQKWAQYSKSLRRDRELAFYGTEDLVPTEFYEKTDATEALKIVDDLLSDMNKIFT